MNRQCKTQKHKQPIDKKNLWKQFDDEIGSPTEPLECVYRSSGHREVCECCTSMLAVTEEGFLACTNKSCGVIYKDILDLTAEWRYYGAIKKNLNMMNFRELIFWLVIPEYQK